MKYSIIASLACLLVLCNSMVCNAQTLRVFLDLRDLENLAIIDNVRHGTLEKMLNHCHTQAGKDYFQRSLRELSYDKAGLEQRQEYLKRLVNNPEVTLCVSDLLKMCGALESSLSSISEHNSTLSILDEFYFKRTACVPLNKNVAALNASFFLHYLNLFAPLLEHALLHIGIDTIFSGLAEKSHHDHHEHHHEHHHTHGTCACSHFVGLSTVMYYIAQGAHWALHVPGYYEIMTHMQTRSKKIDVAQAEIAQFKDYLESVHSIYTELAAHDLEFINEYTPTLTRLFTTHSDDPAASMVTTILGSTWKSSLQSKLNPGAILAMHAELEKHAAMMHKLAHEIGIIDAYVNVSRHFLESKAYCFVTFIESSHPCVHLEGLWHHAIPAETMRSLAVNLNVDNDCLVVRGGNGWGKSTMLTAVGQALFLAQSWTIAPAQSAVITPFSGFYTHSLKRDSIEQGLSHFYHEHAYYENMFTRNDNGYVLILLDEPYTCTDPHTGAEHFVSLTDRIKQSPKKLAIITTHYSA
jgi:DNA mismatch repair ATPase MutS